MSSKQYVSSEFTSLPTINYVANIKAQNDLVKYMEVFNVGEYDISSKDAFNELDINKIIYIFYSSWFFLLTLNPVFQLAILEYIKKILKKKLATKKLNASEFELWEKVWTNFKASNMKENALIEDIY